MISECFTPVSSFLNFLLLLMHYSWPQISTNYHLHSTVKTQNQSNPLSGVCMWQTVKPFFGTHPTHVHTEHNYTITCLHNPSNAVWVSKCAKKMIRFKKIIIIINLIQVIQPEVCSQNPISQFLNSRHLTASHDHALPDHRSSHSDGMYFYCFYLFLPCHKKAYL